jgi:hypothetical protein
VCKRYLSVYPSSNVIRMVKLRIKWAGPVV